MEPAALFVLALAAGAVLLFITELVPPEVTSIGVLLALVVVPLGGDGHGVLQASQALAGFGSDAVITVGSMFVVAAAMSRTGAMHRVADRLATIARGGERRLMLALMITTACISAFINNTAVVAVFIPIGISLARRSGIPPSKLLIPISYGAILGGTTTLIGTSTNVIVSGLAQSGGLKALGMFEFAPVGIAYGVVGIAVTVLWSRRFLPSRETVTSALPPGEVHDYVTELEVLPGSQLIGRTVGAGVLGASPGLRVLQFVRGEEIRWPPVSELVLAAGDLLVVQGDPADLLATRKLPGVVVLPDPEDAPSGPGGRGTVLAELVVAPGSRCIGGSLADVKVRQTYGLAVLAVQRRGSHLREGLSALRLQLGDVLLVQGPPAALVEMRGNPDFLVLEAVDGTVVRRERASRALLITATLVGLIAWRPEWVAALALASTVAYVAAGCVSPREAYRSIEWPILLIIAGMLALGRAFDSTGAARMVAEGALGGFDGVADPVLRAWVVISGLYLLTSVLTEFMSNNAAAALLTPVAISTGLVMGADPRAFVFAVAFAASASFATPVGYQTNTLVYSAGGYRFVDFVKTGAWVNVALWLTASLLIPMFWPPFPG